MNLKYPSSSKKILDIFYAIRHAYPEGDVSATVEKQDQYRLYCALGTYYILKFMETVGWGEFSYELGCGWNGAEEQEIVKKALEQIKTETDKERLMQLYASVATLDCRCFPDDPMNKDIDYILNQVEEKLHD